jgi:hypothetical protein
MLEIIDMMANVLIWKGADLENESDCMVILSKSSFEIRTIGKYVQKAMRVAKLREQQ